MLTSEKLKNLVETYTDEETKFLAGNKSAATRARKALQEIKVAAQEGRIEIQQSKKDEAAAD